MSAREVSDRLVSPYIFCFMANFETNVTRLGQNMDNTSLHDWWGLHKRRPDFENACPTPLHLFYVFIKGDIFYILNAWVACP